MSVIAQRVDADGFYIKTSVGEFTVTAAQILAARARFASKDLTKSDIISRISTATGIPVSWLRADFDEITGAGVDLSVTIP